jgi:hypothetical protein
VIASLPTVHKGRYVVGDRIRVPYDPRAPQQVAISSFEYWLAPGVFLVLGAELIVSALLVR